MIINYPLKQTAPSQFSDALINNLEQTYNTETAYTFKPILTKINELRNRVVTQINSTPKTDQEMDKTIEIVSAYAKYAAIILKRFNWNPQQGKSISGVSFIWLDSFQKVESFKETIAFDIYCCYYNLVVLYFMRASKLSEVDLDSSRKQAISKAKSAAYLLKQIRQKYQTQFMNCGFHDTQSGHLATLQNLCLGLIYKTTYDTFKSNQYKIGINKIASLASFANRYYYKAFGIASGYFNNQASGIFDKTKTQILSIAFVQSLYFDVISNVKLAKYYSNLVQKQKQYFSLVLGYQKKAYRILEIAFNNSNVAQLLNLNPNRQKQLMQLREQLYGNINKDLQRNAQIYQQKQIPQEQLPPAEELPPEMNITLTIPVNLQMENQGQFSKLMSTESSALALQLSNFAKSRKTMLDGSFKKLNDQVTKIFMDTGINFYLDDDDSQIQTIPESIKNKITQINNLGGKYKIQQQIGKISQYSNLANSTFQQLKLKLDKQQAWDQEKRMIYKNQWARPPSDSLNTEYYQKIQVLQSRMKAAAAVDEKVIGKYKKNQLYISVLDQPDEQICLVLPKIQKTHSSQNTQHIGKMREVVQKIKVNAQQVDTVVQQIRDFLDKTNYAMIASDTIGKQKSKQQVFKQTFASLSNKIEQFNMQCKIMKQQVQQAASIAVYLNNSNNKNAMNSSKLEHNGVLSSFNEIQSLFNNLAQSMTFYQKMKDHVMKLKSDIEQFTNNRTLSGQQLENKIKGKGEPGGGTSKIISFPSIYQNQDEFDYNLFQYNPTPQLQTPQPLNPAPGTGVQQQQQNNVSSLNPLAQNGQSDPTVLFNNFCKVLTPEFMNSLGIKKQ